MQHATSKALTDLLLRHGAEQNDILHQVKRDETRDEFLRVRTMIGKTMGALYLDALYPILEEHPDLKPEYLR